MTKEKRIIIQSWKNPVLGDKNKRKIQNPAGEHWFSKEEEESFEVFACKTYQNTVGVCCTAK